MYDISNFKLSDNPASKQIIQLMSDLKTWNLEMDRESLDFWRLKSAQYPYAEYWMKTKDIRKNEKKDESKDQKKDQNKAQIKRPEFLAVLCKDQDEVKNHVVTMRLKRDNSQEDEDVQSVDEDEIGKGGT